MQMMHQGLVEACCRCIYGDFEYAYSNDRSNPEVAATIVGKFITWRVLQDEHLEVLAPGMPMKADWNIRKCRRLTDKGLMYLGGPHLQELTLRHCVSITGDGVAHLLDISPNVRKLDIRGIVPTKLTLASISRLQHLQHLSISNCNDSQIMPILKHIGLNMQFLQFHSCNSPPGITNLTINAIATSCPNLCSIKAKSSNFISADSVTLLLKSCPSLTQLNLFDCTPTPTALPLSSPAPSLGYLTASGVTDDFIASLSQCPQLLSLAISSSPITGCSLHTLARNCASLESLSIRQCLSLANANIEALANVYLENPHTASLTSISLWGCIGVSDSGVAKLLSSLPNLTNVNLSGLFDITDTSVLAVAQHCSQLETIEFTMCRRISDAGVTTLAQRCPGLSTLGLYGCAKITDDSINTICTQCPRLSSLNLYGLTLLTEASLCNIGPHLPRLESLDLSSCYGLASPALIKIARGCPQLQALSCLCCSHITDDGVVEIAKRCPLLSRLQLNSCKLLTDATLHALTQYGLCLTIFSALECLNFTDAAFVNFVAVRGPSLVLVKVSTSDLLTTSCMELHSHDRDNKLFECVYYLSDTICREHGYHHYNNYASSIGIGMYDSEYDHGYNSTAAATTSAPKNVICTLNPNCFNGFKPVEEGTSTSYSSTSTFSTWGSMDYTRYRSVEADASSKEKKIEKLLEQRMRGTEKTVPLRLTRDQSQPPRSTPVSADAHSSSQSSLGFMAGRHKVRTPFVGLQNLGATCYMNSVLQCVFNFAPLRQCLFNWEPSRVVTEPLGKEDPVLLETRYKICSELRRLLACMQYTLKQFISTADFASALRIPTTIQQDPHEFYNLLMHRIEEQFSKTPDMLDSFTTQVTGELTYITQCECKVVSQTKEKFFEIKVVPKEGDFCELMQCLNDFFAQEELSGYKCACGIENAKVSRQPKLSKLPELLNLQLTRFSFDPASMSERKITTPVDIPLSLSLRDFCVEKEGAAGSFDYSLCAVISHIGNSINGGHYIAYTLPCNSPTWWKCDDTSVSAATFPPRDPSQYETPYILFYRKCNMPDIAPHVSPSIQESFEEENSILEKNYGSFLLAEQQERESVMFYLDNYESIFEILPAKSTQDYYWINANWLKDWFLGNKPNSPINNAALVCPHGNATFCKNNMQLMRRISMPAWEFFHSQYSGGPTLSHKQCCIACLKLLIESKRDSKIHEELQTEMSKKVEYASTEGYYVSKQFLEDWKKARVGQKFDAESLVKGIICPHEKIFPPTRAQIISAEVYEYIAQTFLKYAPTKQQRLDASSVSKCTECEENGDNLRILKNEGNILMNNFVSEPWHLNGRYALLSAHWIQKWTHFAEPGMEPPGEMNNSDLFCAHKRPAVDVPFEAFKLPEGYNYRCNYTESAPFRLVPLNIWLTMCDKFGLIRETEIIFSVVKNSNSSWAFHSFEPALVEWKCDPEVCTECISEKQRKRAAADASLDSTELEIRRGYSFGVSVKVPVNSSTSVSDLRLLIFQFLDIAPTRQKLYYTVAGKDIVLKKGTLVSNGVTKSTQIIVQEQYTDTDWEMEDEPTATPSSRKTMAFEGSGLLDEAPPTSTKSTQPASQPPPKPQPPPPQGIPCPHCTFLNPLGSSLCEICANTL
ncbi:ubiquitin carboxyl-terminal hydrolase 48 [Pelomyxa schiedti]|nr:ubiquitin carboxyl-terminal hydrolase 48 [Pelomyxa schiedti]